MGLYCVLTDASLGGSEQGGNVESNAGLLVGALDLSEGY